jgi:hypothetical protein
MRLAMTDTQTDNSFVARRARDLVASHPHFFGRAEIFEFECSENVLVVRGRVPTFYLKQLLQDALKKLDGVRRVDNRVDVLAYSSSGGQDGVGSSSYETASPD